MMSDGSRLRRGRVAAFVCAMAAAVCAWGGEDPDRLELQEALIAQRFADLEQSLAALQRRYKSGATSDQPVAHAFRAFESTHPEFPEPLAAWVKKRPGSAMAHMARAAHLANLGWTSRGTRYAGKTNAGQFARMGRYFREARRELRQAIALDPTLSVAYALAIRLAKADDEQVEGASLTEALRHCPRSFDVRFEHLYGLQPKWGGSLEEMRRFIASAVDPRGDPALAPLRGFPDFSLAEQLYLDKDYPNAVRHYSQALTYGDEPSYFRGRARAYRRLGQLEEALADLDKAWLLNRDSSTILEDRADVYVDSNRLDLALADIQLALRLDPLEPSLLWTRAGIFKKQGKPAEALADYQASLQFGPDNASVYHRMGYVEAELRHDYRAASAFYNKATELAPREVGYWYDFATAMYQRKECEARYPLARYRALCVISSDAACSSERVRWADRALNFIRSNPACAKVTDDTRPQY